VDVRIVAATNRDLKREVNHRRFRSDLYYRLAVVEVRLPPLRERAADMPLLVEAVLADLGAAGSREAAALLRPAVIAELARHQWPGNVRELRNHIERVLAAGAPELPAAGDAGGLVVSVPLERDLPFHAARDRCLAAFERAYLEELLRRHDNNASQAARAAGLARSQLYVVLARRGLR
jgi:DNA-binding NtrC family response regulator